MELFLGSYAQLDFSFYLCVETSPFHKELTLFLLGVFVGLNRLFNQLCFLAHFTRLLSLVSELFHFGEGLSLVIIVQVIEPFEVS